MMRWLKQGGRIAPCIVALAVMTPLTASAQTCPNISISIPTGIANRYYPGSDVAKNLYPTRDANLQPTWINYSDCAADIHLQFTLAVSGLPCSDTIQAWVGPTDCTQLTARQTTSGSPRCWPVSPPQAVAQSFSVDVRAEDIVAFISSEEPPVLYSPQNNAMACQSQAAPGGTALSLYFMAVEANGQAVDGTSAEYDFGADLVGPYAPANITAGIGENIIIVNWTPATDSTIQGFNIYCQNQGGGPPDGASDALGPVLVCPDSGVTTITDTGTDITSVTPVTDAAGCHYVNLADSGGGGSSNCVSSVLKDVFVTSSTGVTTEGGVIAPTIDAAFSDAAAASSLQVGISNIPDMYLCGQVGGNSTSMAVIQSFSDGGANIRDFNQYAVTVAAFDGTGNTGIIGNLSCVIPQPVTDFWTAYTNAGGTAGGGFCALQGPGMPVSTSLFGMGIAGISIGLFRRRRRRR
jgi:hypothetical protein